MAIVLALSAALAYGSADFVGGLASRRTPPVAAAFGAQLGGLLLLLVALPILGGPAPTARTIGVTIRRGWLPTVAQREFLDLLGLDNGPGKAGWTQR